LLGNIKIPLGGGAVFSLGVSGGPLVSGLVLGHFGHVGPVSLRPPKETMEVMREFGLILFLAGAGTEAGEGFLSVLAEYGVGLFVVGAVMTLLPMVVVFWLAKRKMRLTTMNTLGSICGAMTSTPSLGALINVAGTNAVAVSYAATYPVALICVVLFSQFVAIFVK
ncbi:MAG: permease, partial [Oscillibacter sp.]|nr:permease [Oscillibacter sp.]